MSSTPPVPDPSTVPAPARLPGRTAPVEPPPPWWRREVGPLLLSLVLAVLLWVLVRESITIERTTELTVVPIDPDGARAFVLGKASIPLKGPRGEIEAALRRLSELDSTVTLNVGPLRDAPSRPFRHGQDRYNLPIDERLLVEPLRPPLPPGEVVQLETNSSVRLAKPELLNVPEGFTAEVELVRKALTVVAPVGALDGGLTPDAIDVRRHIPATGVPLAAPVRVRLSFDAWRGGPGGGALAEVVKRRRGAVVLEDLEATITFILRDERPLGNALEIWVKRGYEVVEIAAGDVSGFTGRLVSGSGGERVEAGFAGTIRGTAEALDHLARHPDSWRWVLIVPDEDLPGPTEASASSTAELLFLPLGKDQRNDLERGHLQAPARSVTVIVRAQSTR